jgi:hypothetical protein
LAQKGFDDRLHSGKRTVSEMRLAPRNARLRARLKAKVDRSLLRSTLRLEITERNTTGTLRCNGHRNS